MSALFSILLAMVILALIGYPLFRGDRGEAFVAAGLRKKGVSDEKEALMNTLGEIEFDYHMKKLSDEDYESLKNNYAGAAVAAMKAQEEFQGKVNKSKVRSNVKSIEDEIEAELKAMDKQISGAETCHRCGAVLKEAGQEYCHACGERQF